MVITKPPLSERQPACGAALQAVQGSTVWARFPYHEIAVRFADGSVVRLGALDIAWLAAERLARGGVASQERCFKEQVLPLLELCPGLLVEQVERLSWSQIKALSRHTYWRSPQESLRRELPQAEVCLCAR